MLISFVTAVVPVTLLMAGRFNAHEIAVARTYFTQIERQAPGTAVTVDLSDVTSLDSRAAAELLSMNAAAFRAGVSVTVIPSDTVRFMLTLTGYDRELTLGTTHR